MVCERVEGKKNGREEWEGARKGVRKGGKGRKEGVWEGRHV